jgi:hypothetical protein
MCNVAVKTSASVFLEVQRLKRWAYDYIVVTVAVDVGGAVEGVERTAQRAALLRWRNDGLFLLFRDQHRAGARLHQAVDHDLVRQEVQLLGEKMVKEQE